MAASELNTSKGKERREVKMIWIIQLLKKSIVGGNSEKKPSMHCEKKDTCVDAKHKTNLKWPKDFYFTSR